MCGGKADPAPAANHPVELPIRRPAQSSAPPRPPTSTSERPRTKHRPKTSTGEHRPQSHRRPQSERRPRPGSSSTRPPKTSELGRRSSSHREHHPRDRPRNDIVPIQEYTEDRTILRRVADFGTLADQHVVNFYTTNSLRETGEPEMDDPRTRQPALRRYIAERIIHSIINAGRDSSPDTAQIAHEIADDLKEYSNSNGDREDHLKGLCKLADKLRRDIEDHPSSWEFGSLEEEGYIILVPALFKDGEQVIPSQRFRVD